MDVNFRFSNLVGSAYSRGNVEFSLNGSTVYAPVGNKISVFDLKKNISHTLAVESNHSLRCLDVNPLGTHVMTANEQGTINYVNLESGACIYRRRFANEITAIRFQPGGKRLAMCRDGVLAIYDLSTISGCSFNPFLLRNVYKFSGQPLRTVNWSGDGKLAVVGGNDRELRICAAGAKKGRFRQFRVHSMAAHRAPVVFATFTTDECYDVVSIDTTGLASIFECNMQPDELQELGAADAPNDEPNDEDEENEKKPTLSRRIGYKRQSKLNLVTATNQPRSAGDGDSGEKSAGFVYVTAAALHRQSQLLVSAFSNGAFVIHQIPSFSLVHSLQVSAGGCAIRAVAWNSTGDWIAMGCGGGSNSRDSQLLVWEWQSESYALRQQTHVEQILATAFSPDGAYLATAAEDAKVKVWSTRSWLCIVTFDAHQASASAVVWTQAGRALLSAAYDGTVRAHDMKRYRNFRTLTCPEPIQLGSLAVDAAGELVAAGAKLAEQIFVWSLETGQLLDVVAAHTGPVSGLAIRGTALWSCALDATLRMTGLSGEATECVELSGEALSLAMSPSAPVVAVLLADSQIVFFDTNTSQQVGSIDARHDVDPARGRHEKIKRKSAAKHKSFRWIAFSADGAVLTACGESTHVCIYSVADRLLLNRLTLTENRSLDGVTPDVNRRDFTDFGWAQQIETSDEDSEDEGYGKKKLQLAGTRQSELGERRLQALMQAWHVTFAPGGRSLAVASTEGVHIYSLETHQDLFTPFELAQSSTPKEVHSAIRHQRWTDALVHALRLADPKLVQLAVLAVPPAHLETVVRALQAPLVTRLLKWLGDVRVGVDTVHVHYISMWIATVLREHALWLKGRCESDTLVALQHVLQAQHRALGTMSDANHYMLKHYRHALERKKKIEDEKENRDED